MKKPRKPRKKTSLKQDFGKLFQDLGKLIFGGVFIGGILRGDFSHHLLIISGLSLAILLCIVGLFIGKVEIKDEKGK